MGNFLIIIGVVFAVLNAMMKGYIKTVEGGSLILIALVFLIAARRLKLVKLATIAIPIYFFAKEYGFLKPVDFMSLMISVLPLFVMLFGFYIMFRGLFKR